jgi:hypothetical protein
MEIFKICVNMMSIRVKFIENKVQIYIQEWKNNPRKDLGL